MKARAASARWRWCRIPRRSRKSGLLFFNTLFDENAACHIALGQCYSKCFVNGATCQRRSEIAARKAAIRASSTSTG
jgi:leucyl aminopeptidase (aminopeptidase T)